MILGYHGFKTKFGAYGQWKVFKTSIYEHLLQSSVRTGQITGPFSRVPTTASACSSRAVSAWWHCHLEHQRHRWIGLSRTGVWRHDMIKRSYNYDSKWQCLRYLLYDLAIGIDPYGVRGNSCIIEDPPTYRVFVGRSGPKRPENNRA